LAIAQKGTRPPTVDCVDYFQLGVSKMDALEVSVIKPNQNCGDTFGRVYQKYLLEVVQLQRES
jgi:hypothetical protein